MTAYRRRPGDVLAVVDLVLRDRSDAPGDGDYPVISETPRDLSKKINDAEAR
jgi:hypothetical protein